MCDKTHSYGIYLIHMCGKTHSHVQQDSFVRDIPHIHMCDTIHRILMCDKAHSHVHMCDKTHCHMCDVTHSHVRQDSYASFTCAIHRIDMCDKTHSYVRRDQISCQKYKQRQVQCIAIMNESSAMHRNYE